MKNEKFIFEFNNHEFMSECRTLIENVQVLKSLQFIKTQYKITV